MQGSLTTALPASADVTTRDWIQSGMLVQLLQAPALPVTPASSTSGEGSTQVYGQCIARGVLQPHALLDGVTKEWSGRVTLVREVPLFDAKGIRLGLHSGVADTDEVGTITWHMIMTGRLLDGTQAQALSICFVISHAFSIQVPCYDLCTQHVDGLEYMLVSAKVLLHKHMV